MPADLLCSRAKGEGIMCRGLGGSGDWQLTHAERRVGDEKDLGRELEVRWGWSGEGSF